MRETTDCKIHLFGSKHILRDSRDDDPRGICGTGKHLISLDQQSHLKTDTSGLEDPVAIQIGQVRITDDRDLARHLSDEMCSRAFVMYYVLELHYFSSASTYVLETVMTLI